MDLIHLFESAGGELVSVTVALLTVSLILAAGLGYILRKLALRYGSRERRTDRMESQENFLVSGILVLLALMLAFTTNLVVERYDHRRMLVVAEANAIGTAYLRAQALDEPHRTRLSHLLVAYTDNRIRLSTTMNPPTRLIVRNDQLLTDIWAAVLAGTKSAQSRGITTPLYLAFNEMIDLDTERKVARITRVPEGVLATLYVFLLVTTGVLGAVLDGTRQRVTGTLLVGLITMAVAMVIDLNRPTTGVIQENQEALLLLRESMREPASTFDRYAHVGPEGGSQANAGLPAR